MTLNFSKPKILHVDDNQDFLNVFTLRFKKNFDITFAHSGEEALEMIECRDFDVIITDYEMPGINGLDLLRILRDRGIDIPVMFYTGQGNEQIAREAFILGADDYFTKDLRAFAHAEKLINAVNKAVEIRHSRQKMENNEKKFFNLYSSMNEGVCIHEIVYGSDNNPENYRILDVNPAYERIIGMKSSEVCGRLATDVYRSVPPPYMNIYLKVAQTGEPASFETYYSPMGKYFQISVFSPEKNCFATVFSDITEKKLIEQSLRKSKERFRSLVDATSDWIWEIDENLRYTYVGSKIRDILGYEPENILGKTPFDLMPPNEARKIKDKFLKFLSQKESFKNLENINANKDGHSIILETSGVPFYDSEGNFRGYRGIDRDITMRRTMEEQSRLYEQRFYNIFKKLRLISMVLDADGNIVFCNNHLQELTGKNSDEYLGRNWFETFIRKENHHRNLNTDHFKEMISGSSLPLLQSEILTSDDKRRLISWLNNPIYEEKDKITGVLIIGEDITDKKNIEMQLIQERNMFVDGPAVVFKWTNKEGWPVEYVSPNVEDVMGWSVEEFISGRILYEEQILPEDIEIATLELVVAVEANLTYYEHSPYRIRTKDGRIIWVTDYTSVIKDEKGEITHFLGYVVDISRQKIAEEELRQSSSKWKAIFDSINDYIALIDGSGTVLRSNRALKEFLGKSEDEIAGRKCWELLHGSSQPIDECPVVKMQETGKRESLELEIKDKWFLITVDPIFNEDGVCTEAVHIMTDITHRKLFEKILMEKNKELNDFAYRVSHNMKNYIFNLNGYISAINDDRSLFGQYYGNVLRQTENLTSFINRLLTLSRAGKTVSKMVEIDMNELLKKAFCMIRRDGIKAELNILNHLPEIMGDPESIEELFMNLLENSIKYGNPDKDTIAIDITCKKDGGYVCIIVKDNGMGIDDEHLDKVFSPGYTLHKNKGTGFGMTIAKKIAEAHSGSIRISSEGKNRGTVVSVKLPVRK